MTESVLGAMPTLTWPESRAVRAARAASSAWRSASWAWRQKASPASVGTTPVEVRWSSRVDSSLSSRLICWLSADVTTPSRWAACPMLPNSTTCTK
ncbi:hypothetical protein D3C81_1071860 [compost metagenome]